MSETDLIERLRNGDPEAFATLVDRYHGSMVGVAQGIVRSRAQAEEVAQDAWASVVKNIDRFEERSSFKTWLFRIVTNRAKTVVRREGRYDLSVDDDDAPNPLEGRLDRRGHWADPPHAWPKRTPEAVATDRQALFALRAAIEELPENWRVVVTLRDVEGLGSDEVCELLEISAGNQRVILHRARTRLRVALEHFYRGS